MYAYIHRNICTPHRVAGAEGLAGVARRGAIVEVVAVMSRERERGGACPHVHPYIAMSKCKTQPGLSAKTMGQMVSVDLK